MALKTFTGTRAPQAGDSKRLASWALSAGGTALKVTFCDGTNATPIFEVQVPANRSASDSFWAPCLPVFSRGLHVEVVSGALNRGEVDLV